MEYGKPLDAHEWYEDYFDDDWLNYKVDGRWMSNLSNCQTGPRALKEANRVAVMGSDNLSNATKDDARDIVTARREFFEDVLGWGDEDHPLHDAYGRLTDLSPSLISPVTLIATQRVLARRNIDTAKLFTRDEASLILVADTLERRLKAIENCGLDPKLICEGSERVLHVAPATIIGAYEAISSSPGLNVAAILKRAPELLASNPVDLKQRIDFFLSMGIEEKIINKNPGMLTYSIGFIEKFIERMHAEGLDPVYIINHSMYALGSRDELLLSRIEGLKNLGLDPVRAIGKNATLLNSRTELIHSKLLTIKAILRYIKSPLVAEEVANERPLLLGRRQEKLRASVRILRDSVDPKYIANLSAVRLYSFVMMPLDTIFAAVARQKTDADFAPNGITAAHLARIRIKTPPPLRRQKSIEILCDNETRNLVGLCAVRAYLESAPLTEEELNEYPDLTDVRN